MKDKKYLVAVLVISILIITVSMTYAYFEAQGGESVTRDVRIQTHTVDLLTFEIDNDIEFEIMQADFAQGEGNTSSSTGATAILTPNSKTGAATENYYMYLNIETNEIDYSSTNTNGDPELLLQVFDSNGDLVEIDYFDDTVEYGNLEGYDITGISGIIPILENQEIEATGGNTEEQEWTVVVTMINLDVDQQDNTGKDFEASVIMQKEGLDLGFSGIIYRNNTTMVSDGSSIIPENGTRWCDIETSTGDQYDCFYEQNECEQFLVDGGYTATDTCEQIIGTFGGVGSYETNVNTIRTKTYNVYCPIGGTRLTCANDWYYLDEESCQNDVYTNTYTCTAGIVTKPFYLKHEVRNDLINSTETCLYYNNHEFCMSSNYWVANDSDGSLTRAKLQADMEEKLGVAADNCILENDAIYCNFDEFSCSASANGMVDCASYGRMCSIASTGESACGW